jgi:hypothetical protein
VAGLSPHQSFVEFGRLDSKVVLCFVDRQGTGNYRLDAASPKCASAVVVWMRGPKVHEDGALPLTKRARAGSGAQDSRV